MIGLEASGTANHKRQYIISTQNPRKGIKGLYVFPWLVVS